MPFMPAGSYLILIDLHPFNRSPALLAVLLAPLFAIGWHNRHITDDDSSKGRLLFILRSRDRGHEGRHPNIQRSGGRRGGLWGTYDLRAD